VNATQARTLVLAAAIAMTVAVTLLDARLDPAIRLEVLYVVPILAATWVGGLRWGVPLAMLSLVGGALGDTGDTTTAVLAWNTGGELVVIVVLVFGADWLRHMLDEQRALATTDPLTGLLNRRAFAVAVTRELARSRRRPTPSSLVFFDLDGLKVINDRSGHGAGDKALICVADAANGSIRGTDLAARVGGDEFALFLPDTDAASARGVVARMQDELSLHPPHPQSSINVGIVTQAGPLFDLDHLIREADQLMYGGQALRRQCRSCGRSHERRALRPSWPSPLRLSPNGARNAVAAHRTTASGAAGTARRAFRMVQLPAVTSDAKATTLVVRCAGHRTRTLQEASPDAPCTSGVASHAKGLRSQTSGRLGLHLRGVRHGPSRVAAVETLGFPRGTASGPRAR
jgi:diguanylate cyclase (GGDEF)-like protein